MLKAHLYKEYSLDDLSNIITKLDKKINSNTRIDIKTTYQIFDELYAITFCSIKMQNKRSLYKIAELFKAMYERSFARKDENEYWQEVVLAAVGAEDFQAVELLLDNVKFLLKQMPEKQVQIIADLKMVANIAARKNKYFICAKVVGILLYWVPKLSENEDDEFSSSVIRCLENNGSYIINAKECRLFSDMCKLVTKNINETTIEQEKDWDTLLLNWGYSLLQENLVEEFLVWENLLVKYGKMRLDRNREFYIDLLFLSTRFAGKVDNAVLGSFVSKIVTMMYYNSRPENFKQYMDALSSNFKIVVSNLAWQKSLIIFKPIFVAALHMTARQNVVDDKEYDRKRLLKSLNDIILDSISFTSIKLDNLDEIQVLALWRNYFLQQSRSNTAKFRVKQLWLMLVDNWKKRHPIKSDECTQMLKQFID